MKIVGQIEKTGNPLPFRIVSMTAFSQVVFNLSSLYYALIPLNRLSSIDPYHLLEIVLDQYVIKQTYIVGYILKIARQ